MRKTAGMLMVVVAAFVIFAGCETMKGVGRDVTNTGNNAVKTMNALNEMDRKFQEKYW